MTDAEIIIRKKRYNQSTDSEKGVVVFDNYTHKIYVAGDCYGPVTVWEAATSAQGVLASEVDISQNPTWQITNLNMSMFSSVELYIASGGTGNDITPSAIIKIDLSDINASTFGHFLGSTTVQYPNNRNKILALSAAISSDKTSVLFNRCTSIDGNTSTSANTGGRILYKIIGNF
jgi:hypothetical protein